MWGCPWREEGEDLRHMCRHAGGQKNPTKCLILHSFALSGPRAPQDSHRFSSDLAIAAACTSHQGQNLSLLIAYSTSSEGRRPVLELAFSEGRSGFQTSTSTCLIGFDSINSSLNPCHSRSVCVPSSLQPREARSYPVSVRT